LAAPILASIPAMIAGYGAKRTSEYLAQRNVDELVNLIAHGGDKSLPVIKNALQLMAESKRQAIAKALALAGVGASEAWVKRQSVRTSSPRLRERSWLSGRRSGPTPRPRRRSQSSLVRMLGALSDRGLFAGTPLLLGLVPAVAVGFQILAELARELRTAWRFRLGKWVCRQVRSAGTQGGHDRIA
jgi:hypothetical protein